MDSVREDHGSWIDYLALLFALLAAAVSFGGAFQTYTFEGQIPDNPLWPLPGLILSEWVLLGVIGFFVAFLCTRSTNALWLKAAWIITGTFIPLIILGAFSIGIVVLIAFGLLVISTSVYTLRKHGKWLESFGYLMAGSLVNLAILWVIITVSNSNY